jgi:hypothetical protein
VQAETKQRISEYCDPETKQVPECADCQCDMERMLVMGATNSGAEYALAGDRHYEGMQAPDGSDISSRSKHREFMKRTGLTTSDDFKGEWTKASKERQEYRSGTREDKGLRQFLERQLHTRSS